jgi:Tol biopolymer transport system component
VGCSGLAAVHGDVSTRMPTSQLTNTDTPVPIPQPTEVDTPTPVPATAEAPTPVSTVTPHATPEGTPYEGEPFTIVYQRCGELFVSEVGGRGEWPLTNEDVGTNQRPCLGVSSLFSVSPDGQRVAYVVGDGQNDFVKVVSLPDGSRRVVGSTSEPQHVYIFERPVWWDNTHIAYYICEPPPTKEDHTIQMKELVVVDLETGESTAELFSAFQYPSPDGRYVLSGHSFRSLDPSCQLYQLYDRETGKQWVVIDEDTPAGFMGWSPEGQLALFILIVEEESEVGSEVERLLVVDAETHEQRLVSPEDKVAYGPGAAWSPDGQTIAYRQCDPPATLCGNPELWLTSPDGTNRRQIPMKESIPCIHLSWTPDGSRLVFETIREPSIWSVRLDGTDLRPIADGQDPQVLPAP